jgi:pimeloyl-ACP methyl ester carboxylesterase
MEIHGGRVVYEIVGPQDGRPMVLTPGGRFGKDIPGLKPLAEALAEGGMRVLLWDRPNCGASDVQFYGRSESHMRADTLAELLQRLDMAPAVIAGGSGGSRDSMVTVMQHPEIATKLAVWWIVGGVVPTLTLGSHYVLGNLSTARRLGMDGVLALPEWEEQLTANPRNKERMLELGKDEFVRAMMRWINAYIPKPGQTIPGVEDAEFERIKVPALVVRNGEDDWDHPKRTSFEVHSLIKGSRLVEPPWPEDAWERSTSARAAGTGNLFDVWVRLAPMLLDFINEPVKAPAAGGR